MTEPARAMTPLPKREIFSLILLFGSEAYHYAFLFSFVGFMVLDLGLVSEEKDAGWYASLLTGCYSLAQLFSGFVFIQQIFFNNTPKTSVIFGYILDKISMKYFTLVTNTIVLISCLMFGFSRSLWWALCWRSLGGFFNGNLAVCKSYMYVFHAV